eukprot:239393-Pelagomonas_calceolata.AAC.8
MLHAAWYRPCHVDSTKGAHTKSLMQKDTAEDPRGKGFNVDGGRRSFCIFTGGPARFMLASYHNKPDHNLFKAIRTHSQHWKSW